MIGFLHSGNSYQEDPRLLALKERLRHHNMSWMWFNSQINPLPSIGICIRCQGSIDKVSIVPGEAQVLVSGLRLDSACNPSRLLLKQPDIKEDQPLFPLPLVKNSNNNETPNLEAVHSWERFAEDQGTGAEKEIENMFSQTDLRDMWDAGNSEFSSRVSIACDNVLKSLKPQGNQDGVLGDETFVVDPYTG